MEFFVTSLQSLEHPHSAERDAGFIAAADVLRRLAGEESGEAMKHVFMFPKKMNTPARELRYK
jgi:hypothetical protein